MIKVGIIGMGIRGSLYAKTIEYNPFAEVVGIVEADGPRRKDAEKHFNVSAYTDIQKLCEIVDAFSDEADQLQQDFEQLWVEPHRGLGLKDACLYFLI